MSLLLCFLALTVGCERFHHLQHETVYVSARQMYLRDRVAAVSNRVAEVTNGQPLEVLEHGRRFLKVKTDKKQIGWIDQHSIIDSKTYDSFVQMASQHKQDPVIATATLSDDLYLHQSPGRKTEHFYLLPGNTKLQLLVRASVPKVIAPGFGPVVKPVVSKAAPNTPPKSALKTVPPGKTPPSDSEKTDDTADAAPVPVAPPPIAMEDWWLVRDGQGRVGWILANRLDVDVPEEIATYSEGQRIVGAYLLTKITDYEVNTPNHMVSEYVTVLSPLKSGLPFDFDQVRVFTWSLKRHRYETAFRLRPIQGFLPVRVSTIPSPKGNIPVFSFQIANGQAPAIDPATGIVRPKSPRTISYALVDSMVKRIGPDMGPIPLTEQPDDKSKSGKPGKKSHK